MKQDTIEIEILGDGTLKVSTDKISLPNHCNAAQFIAETARLAGGTVKTERKGAKFTHTQHTKHTTQQKANQ